LGFRQHYRIAPWSRFVEVHWSDCGQMYVTPVSHDEVCVAFITRAKNLRFEQALSHFPELATRLSGAARSDRLLGSVTASRHLKRLYRDNIVLIGEAAGSVDAITGEGLAVAFQQAVALASALRAGDLTLYEAAHRRIMRLPRTMAALMLTMDRRPLLRRRVFRALTAQPESFARMLAIHTGEISPLEFGLRNTVSLGWRMLAATG
jgi:flavin-dependent dehydrogenase